MRYHIEEFVYDGNEMRISGWCMPEYSADTLLYELRDAEDRVIPLSVGKTARPDVGEALNPGKAHSDYGFSIRYRAENYGYTVLHVRTAEHEIDHIRIPLRMDEAFAAYRKEKRRGRLKSRRKSHQVRE